MLENNSKSKLISLSEAAKLTPYSGAYLNVLIKRKKLKGQKMGRNWHTTKEWVKEYLLNSIAKSSGGDSCDVVAKEEAVTPIERKSVKDLVNTKEEEKPRQMKNEKKEELRELKKSIKEIHHDIEKLNADLSGLQDNRASLEAELERVIVGLDNNYRQKIKELNEEIEKIRRAQRKMEKDYFSEIKL